ncbi:MAG TPA: FAD-dependent oxidoreductase [Deltaproteobacteria bacterium]|nr:FAD-dependent oxidoreductase [Deltaproteobacteria bacterium]
MKRPKDRLHKVIVIGATPAGIAAANKLGELGIPVMVVDSESDLDRKLAREEWRLESGVPFNFAQRSGLIRLMQNPLIDCVLPARVESLKHTSQGFRAKIRKSHVYVDPDRCVLCGRCVQVCPVLTPDGSSPILFNNRRSLPGRPVIDKRMQPQCQAGCPLGVNAQAYIALTRAGRYREAFHIIREDNVLPGICGRICTHPCEASCRRGELDEPIAIRDIKRFLTDYAASNNEVIRPAQIPGNGRKIAVVGSGPAGLAAAADLARWGYGVTIFEKEEKLGGLLQYGIGPHRLPRNILDRDLAYIRNLGVTFVTSRAVDFQNGWNRLKSEFDAVILTTGSWADRRLGVPGEDLTGVDGCLHVLRSLYRNGLGDGDETAVKIIKKKKESIAVIGDGNAAFDLARTMKRLGDQVTIVTWFPEEMIPADRDELREAVEEGIQIVDRTQVVAFRGEDGRFTHLECRPTEPGEPDSNGIPWPVIIEASEKFPLPFDRAIVAIGQTGAHSPKESGRSDDADGLAVTSAGFLQVNQKWHTNIPSVYAAGDVVSGPSSVVVSMASGRSAARSVHEDLSGIDVSSRKNSRPEQGGFPDIPKDIPSLARVTMPERQPSARKDSFLEVALGLGETQALFESERCLQCGICSECFLCQEACGAISAINHKEGTRELIEHAGVVIIADPENAPPIKGEDVVRAYGPKTARSDVHAMITRGFAAAANAMIMLSSTSQRPRGRGVSFLPPDPDLSPEIRIGIFVCRCNDALGWLDEMDQYVQDLKIRENVVHAEVLNAACIPEGSVHILRSIREKGITRMVLASCVCCPLDFVCSTCSDQRSRLKNALFRGTGVSRSMVETCNLRGEALRYIAREQTVAVERFSGLIDRSIKRVENLMPLPAPVRTYNFTTAVIGSSEAALTSAKTLSRAGLEVFLFGNRDKLPEGELQYQNIHCFEGATVNGISGTLGNFHIYVNTDSFSQTIQVGAVILGEKSRASIPYIPQEGLDSSMIASKMQSRGVTGIPFLYPGATSIAGLFLANPTGVHVSERIHGSAAALLAAAVMPRGPRQSKGFTVVVDEEMCRGCGRCLKVCPYQAITLHENRAGGWHGEVDEALCKGCGNCISVCPSNAADSPYRNQKFLENLLKEVLVQPDRVFER